MQYTVIIAEDEPLALKTVCSIIEKKCPNFRIAATAEDGQDALDKIRRLKPDLVISDIKMPLMTGVEIAEILHRELPDILVLIISGYAEFKYAQSAIRSGVSDYLLKPIVPSALKNAMELAEKKIRQIHYYRRNRVICKLANSEEVPKQVLLRYFPYRRLYIAVMCRGNLPGRYVLTSGREIYSGIEEQYFIFGRSENEALYIVPEELLPGNEFQNYIIRMCEGKGNEDDSFKDGSTKDGSVKDGSYKEGSYTLVYRKEAISAERLQQGIRELYRVLDFNGRIGETTIVEIDKEYTCQSLDKETQASFEKIIRNISSYAAVGTQDKIRSEIARSYEICAAEHCSQLWVENWTRELTLSLFRHGLMAVSPDQMAPAFGDLFSQAESMHDISDGVIALCLGEETEKRADKVDSQEFFDRIYAYLRQNLDKQISIGSLCDTFGISQTYVGKLFRKYADASFSQTLTQMRIDRAKEMFDGDPKPFIKDVATAVGYTDQFYFSRVFRSYTGMSPTEYMKDE